MITVDDRVPYAFDVTKTDPLVDLAATESLAAAANIVCHDLDTMIGRVRKAATIGYLVSLRRLVTHAGVNQRLRSSDEHSAA
jgi:hypothetical protein